MPDPCPSPFNLSAHVLTGAGAPPERLALSVLSPDGPDDWSFGRLEQAVRGTAAGLLHRGLGPGDRILMRLDNTVDFPILFLAAIAVDLVPVPTSGQLTEPEISGLADRLAPSLIASAPGIALPRASDIPVLDLAGLRALRNHAPADFAMGDPHRPGYIVFTSGTSGRARGVVHAHRAVWARRRMIDGWYAMTDSDRVMHAGAFNWTFTLGTGLLDPWSIGATALVPAPGTPPAALPDLLARHGATLFAAAPGIYRQMLRAPLPSLPALRHGLSAGEKLPDASRLAWEAATGTAIHEAFGMSECSTFISGSPARPAPPGALGRAQPGRRVTIRNQSGAAGIGTPGEIAVSADDPGLMLGYLDDPHETAARIVDGWFLTGDMGSMDADGAVRYLGRADDMMNAGGYRVSPIEVEQVIATCPGIADVAVTEVSPRPDTRIIAAFYVAARDLDEDALARHCAARLARYKCPRLFRRIAAIPRGANGKLARRRLRMDFRSDP